MASCPALLEDSGPVGVISLICTVPDGQYRPPACFKRSQKYSQTIAQILEVAALPMWASTLYKRMPSPFTLSLSTLWYTLAGGREWTLSIRKKKIAAFLFVMLFTMQREENTWQTGLGWWWCAGRTSSRCTWRCRASRSCSASLWTGRGHPSRSFIYRLRIF